MLEENSPNKVKDWLLSQCKEAEAVTEIPSLEFDEQEGAILECGIEHIVSPSLFYINLTDKKYKGLELLQLNEELTHHIARFSHQPHQPVECGHYVAVREKIEGTYCAFRGQILDEIKNKAKIKVLLVDFGDTIEVRERDIRPLPQEFASFPQFAVPCCLKNVEPLQGNNDYSSDAVNFFHQLAPKEKLFRFKFDKTKEQTYPMSVEMFMDENCQKTFAEVLIRRQFVKSIDPPPEWNPMAADYQKPVVAGNNEGYNGLGGNSEDRLCKFYRFNGNCKRGKNCSFLHVQTGSPFNMSDNDAVMTVTHHELELPGPGEKIDNIRIPVVRHCHLFYATMSEESKKQIEELTEEMTEFYNSSRTINSRPLSPGEIVAAQYKDEKWFRARIIEVTEASDEYIDDFAEVEKIRVFYVDYGQAHTVDMLSIREIKPAFLQLPFQAVECSLGRVMSIRNELNPTGKWPHLTSQKFRQLTSSSYRLRAKVLSAFGNRLELDLDYDKDGTDNWTNIADTLISKNLAAPCKPMTNLQRSPLICPG